MENYLRGLCRKWRIWSSFRLCFSGPCSCRKAYVCVSGKIILGKYICQICFWTDCILWSLSLSFWVKSVHFYCIQFYLIPSYPRSLCVIKERHLSILCDKRYCHVYFRTCTACSKPYTVSWYAWWLIIGSSCEQSLSFRLSASGCPAAPKRGFKMHTTNW